MSSPMSLDIPTCRTGPARTGPPSTALPVIASALLLIPTACLSRARARDDRPKRIPTLDISLRYEAAHCLQAAFTYLLEAQDPNGSWKNDPAITSLVLYSFLLPPEYKPEDRTAAALEKGFDYLDTFVKRDGGIYDRQFKNYTTAVALLAFTEAHRSEYDPIIHNAKRFLIQFQLDEGENIDRQHPYYGGIGYGGDDRPDLSNTQFALDAIKAAELYQAARGRRPANTEPGEHWRKALVFLARTQNLKAVNDMPYAADDGGFIYETGHYKQERSRSYGSMTFAGLKSLLLAGVDEQDPRVSKALAWIAEHYSLDENPGFGTTSLYYYYMTAAKCLATLGRDLITDARGVRHNWRRELIQKLASIQHGDGYWVNSDGRYWENIKELATAYAAIAMKFALKDTLVPVPLSSQ